MYRRMTAVCLALLSVSAAAHCVKTGSVCTEGGATRLVDGIPVTRECWSERETWACLTEDTGVNGCRTLDAAPEDAGCRQAAAVCRTSVSDAQTGETTCLVWDEAWQCEKKIELPAENAQWKGTGTAAVETEDDSACRDLAEDESCTRTRRDCTGSDCTVTYECGGADADACAELKAAGCTETKVPTCPAGEADCRVKTGEVICVGEVPEVPGSTVTAEKVETTGAPAMSTAGCAAAADGACRETSSRCTEKGGIRVINGRTYYERCWGYTKTYECSVAADSTCGGLEAAGCTVADETCEATDAAGVCIAVKRTYRCAQTPDAGNSDYAGEDKLPAGTVTVSDCAAVTDAGCTLESSVCLKSDPTDPRQCLEREFQYRCGGGSADVSDDCAALEADARCRVTDTQCLGTDAAGNCTMTTKTYVCAGTTTEESVGEVCGTDLCLGGVCRPQGEKEVSEDFLASAAVMEIVRQAAAYGDVGASQLFSGVKSGCSVKAAGFSCCRAENAETTAGMTNSLFGVAVTTGLEAAWEGFKYVGSPYVYDLLAAGGDATSGLLTRLYGEAGSGVYSPSLSLYGVSASVSGGSLTLSFSPAGFLTSMATQMAAEYFACTAQDQLHALRRSQNLCRYVGSYCAKKGGSACLEKKESWCCFNSRLALIVQTEGRKQLGLGWGTPESPACRGLTLEEFQALDFSAMDLTPVMAEMAAEARKTVSADKTALRAADRVTEAAADPDAQYREIAPWNGKRATGAMGSRMVRRFP